MTSKGTGNLTEQSMWDEYWSQSELPAEVTRRAGDRHGNAILDVFDRYLPADGSITVAEIGGSPGQYLAYLHRKHGCAITCIDYSHVGCAKTLENFRLLGIQGQVIEADIFEEIPDAPSFDVVYSLGLIEHFEDLEPIVGRHAALVRPGGWLILGVPNFQGMPGWFLRRLAPRTYREHQIEAMNLSRWRTFEHTYGLQPVFKAYIGGFAPRVIRYRRERPRRAVAVPLALLAAINWALDGPARWLQNVDGRLISSYAMAVYRVRQADVDTVPAA